MILDLNDRRRVPGMQGEVHGPQVRYPDLSATPRAPGIDPPIDPPAPMVD
jgi:hypothetical protein